MNGGAAGRVCTALATYGEIIAAYGCGLAAGRTAARDRHRGSDRVPVRARAAGRRGRGGGRTSAVRRREIEAGGKPARGAFPGAVRAGARRQHGALPRCRRGAAAGGQRDRGRGARGPPGRGRAADRANAADRSEEHTSELQSHVNLVCRLLLEKKHTHPHIPSAIRLNGGLEFGDVDRLISSPPRSTLFPYTTLYRSLSAQALDASTARFLDVAGGRLQAANATAAGELEVRRAAVEQLIEPMLQ